MAQFRAWRYRHDGTARLFESLEEFEAAGDGWSDSPAAAAAGVPTLNGVLVAPDLGEAADDEFEVVAIPTPAQLARMRKAKLVAVAQALGVAHPDALMRSELIDGIRARMDPEEPQGELATEEAEEAQAPTEEAVLPSGVPHRTHNVLIDDSNPQGA